MLRRSTYPLLLLALSLVMPGSRMSQPLLAQDAPIQYVVSFQDCERHTIDIEAWIPTSGQDRITLMLPTWTPGSYLIREYAKNLDEIKAINPTDGSVLPLEKIDKNHWQVTCREIPLVAIRYRIYCREMGVRNNWVERDFGFLMGAATFITRQDWLNHPHIIRLSLPSQWPHVATSLPQVDQPETRRAENYDILVDSPILMGRLDQRSFEVGGKKHVLVNALGDELWDAKRAVEDMAKIVQQEQAFWGDIPYENYHFLNIISESGGGLEHDNSCVLMTSRWAMKRRAAYTDWLALVSHEFFHAWNVRRLRPQALMRYNYDGEQYFPELWVAEGITSYYDDLFLPKAGICSRDEYLARLGKHIASIQTTPGRSVQSLAESSIDTWIKFYRPDENSGNTRISYYTKGAIVGFLLDAEIQRATQGQKQLMDVMRLLWQRHRTTGYTQADLQAAANEVAGINLDAWMKKAVFTTEELDYQPALEWFGLRFKGEKKDPPPSSPATPGSNGSSPTPTTPPGPAKPEEPLPGWLGADVTSQVVKRVPRGTPADEAGLNVDDEVLAINEYRVTGDLNDRLSYYKPGERVSLLVARRGKIMTLEVTLGTRPTTSWQIEVLPDATEEQKSRLAKWLGPITPLASKP